MMEILSKAAKDSIFEVMETMFYLPVEFVQESILGESGLYEKMPGMACQLEFTGDFSGYLTLFIPKDLLIDMTKSFMGESQKNPEKDVVLGTLTETLNMICGNALSRVDSKNPFQLDLPEVIDESKLSQTQTFIIMATPQSMMAISITMN